MVWKADAEVPEPKAGEGSKGQVRYGINERWGKWSKGGGGGARDGSGAGAQIRLG